MAPRKGTSGFMTFSMGRPLSTLSSPDCSGIVP